MTHAALLAALVAGLATGTGAAWPDRRGVIVKVDSIGATASCPACASSAPAPGPGGKSYPHPLLRGADGLATTAAVGEGRYR